MQPNKEFIIKLSGIKNIFNMMKKKKSQRKYSVKNIFHAPSLAMLKARLNGVSSNLI